MGWSYDRGLAGTMTGTAATEQEKTRSGVGFWTIAFAVMLGNLMAGFIAGLLYITFR